VELLPLTLARLLAERAIDKISSFQNIRSARLILAHQRSGKKRLGTFSSAKLSPRTVIAKWIWRVIWAYTIRRSAKCSRPPNKGQYKKPIGGLDRLIHDRSLLLVVSAGAFTFLSLSISSTNLLECFPFTSGDRESVANSKAGRAILPQVSRVRCRLEQNLDNSIKDQVNVA
jgi:hypothetical protein